jgi:heme A synthase
MTHTADQPRPVPRWLHVWAVLCVLATFVLLLIGQLVTSFRAGMADWVWPTEPWYVFRTATDVEKQRFRDEFPYFIEHTHRMVGWTVGGLAIVLAVGLAFTSPRRGPRWAVLAGLIVLIVGYGEFHRGLMAQRDVPAADVRLPLTAVGVVGAGLLVVLIGTLADWLAGSRGVGLRLLGVLALVGVMIQGLLGGFRVKLNELVGTDLAAVHGVFAQVVFGLLVTLAVLTARPPSAERPSCGVRTGSLALAVLLFVQVIWGAMIRHDPEPLTQRLHFLTAFLATAAAVLVLRSLFADPAGRSRVRLGGYLLCGLLVAQLYLGVEAWMDKFGAYTLPESVPVTRENATIRTLHALVGSALLATAVGLAVRVRQRTMTGGDTGTRGREDGEQREAEEKAASPRVGVAVRPLVHHGGDAT